MSVSGEGSGVAGTSYSLTCRVRLPPGVYHVSPNMQWKRPNMPFTPAPNPSFAINSFLATLQLPSIQSSDAGNYLCQASYSLGGHTSPLANGSFTLVVTGKLATVTLTCLLSHPQQNEPTLAHQRQLFQQQSVQQIQWLQ